MPKFSKTNQPNRRKAEPPLDTPEGLDPAKIDKVIEGADTDRESGWEQTHRPAPRPHTKVFDLTPAPEEIEPPRILPAADALAKAKQEQAAVAQRLAEIEAEQQELNQNVVEAQREIAAKRLAAQQAKDTAEQHAEDARQRLRAKQIAEEVQQTLRLAKERAAAQRANEAPRRAEHEAKLRKELQPVYAEYTALRTLRDEYGEEIAAIKPMIYSKLPVTWPLVLRTNIEGCAVQAKEISETLQQSIAQMERVLALGKRMVQRGPVALPVNGIWPPGAHDQEQELDGLRKEIVGCRDHAYDLKRRIGNLVRTWGTLMAEAKRYDGGPVQPEPVVVAVEDDPRRQMIRAWLGDLPKHGGVVRDGAKLTEQEIAARQQERAHPGKQDPLVGLP